MQNNKQDALQDILQIAQAHKITMADISDAFAHRNQLRKRTDSENISKLFAYIGSILVFSGVCIFLSMQWAQMSSAMHLLASLGCGFIIFLIALTTTKNARYEKASTPLFLIAFALESWGLSILVSDFGISHDTHHEIIFASFLMLIQQGCAFWWSRKTVLALTSVISFCALCITTLSLFGVLNQYFWTALGILLLKIGYDFERTPQKSLSPAAMFAGGILVLSGTFSIVNFLEIEILYLGVSALMIFVSVAVRSKILLALSTLAMVSYISYFTANNFANTVGWPVSLMVIGAALIGFGALAVRLNEKYMRR